MCQSHPVYCMDCGSKCGTSEISGSTTICNLCLVRRYGPSLSPEPPEVGSDALDPKTHKEGE